MNKSNFGVYIHIPFCMSKCSYCSFISKCANEEEIEKYFDALINQIILQSGEFKGREITSVYFGGGTPSVVDSKYIEEVLKALKKHYKLSKNIEISIECNPCSTSADKLNTYKKAGVNRISFGVQSLNNECLKIIGRKHNACQALNAIGLAKKCGFKNISADLLIGIPNQTISMLKNDLKTLVNAGANHISAYMLMLEEGTKLYEQVIINNVYKVANDDLCVDMYNMAYSTLKELGFKRYEISNFCIPGYECKHNINYWDMGEYVGFGLASHSFYNGKRISGFTKFDDYYNYVDFLTFNNGAQIQRTQKPENYNINGNSIESNEKLGILGEIKAKLQENTEKLDNNQIIEETIMLGLRQEKGVNINVLNNLGYDILNLKSNILDTLFKNNFIIITDNYIKVEEKAFGACNQIILNLLP